MSKQTILAFHIGRGGQFHNSGHRAFIGERKISDFTEMLFLKHENQTKFRQRFGYDQTSDPNQRCILDLISNEDYDELEEKFGIAEADLGERIYFDGGGHPVGLTEKEAESGVGRIDIDGEYDTTYTTLIDDLDEVEVALILESGRADRYLLDELEERGFLTK